MLLTHLSRPRAISVQDVQRLAVYKADFVRCNTDNRSILSVNLEYIIMPRPSKVSNVYPELAKRCEERSGNTAERVQEDIVRDLQYV